MRKTTIVIDEALLARAEAVLGTKGIKATVHRALDDAVRLQLRMQLAERIRRGEGTDLADDEVMAGAWR